MIEETTTPQTDGRAVSQWRTGGINLLLVAWQRKSIVLLCIVVALILAGAYYAQAKPIYQSASQVVVIKKSIDSGIANIDARHASYDDYVTTHLTIIRSPVIVEKAIEKGKLREVFKGLDMDKAIEEDFPGVIIGRLNVARDRSVAGGQGQNNVMRLTFDSPDPEISPKVLQAVIDSYKDYLDVTYRNVSTHTAELIDNAQKSLKDDIEKKEREYEKFRNEAPVASFRSKEGALTMNDRLQEMERTLARVRLRKTELQSRRESIELGMERGERPEYLIAAATQFLDRLDVESGRIQQQLEAQQTLSLLLLEEKKLLETRGPNHPEVLAHRQKIELARASLADPAALWRGGTGGPLPPLKAEGRNSGDLLQTIRERLKQEQENLEIQEKNYDAMLGKEYEGSRQLYLFDLKDQIYRKDLDRLEKLHEVILKRLSEVNIIKEMGGFDASPIAPPKIGRKISPRGIIIFPIGLMLGLVAGVGLAFLADLADQSFRNPDEIRRALNLPLIGQIPALRAQEAAVPNPDPRIAALDPLLLSFHSPLCPESEAYRGVRTALYFSGLSGHRVIQVTSPNSGDGKSTLTANLAISIAQSGKRVLLVDADLRKPRAHTIFGIAAQTGLGSIMMQSHEPADAIQETCIEGLSLLPCGPIPPNPAELLTSPRFKDLLDYLREQFDFVLVDTPPLLMVTDPTIVAARVDGVILTVRLTRDTRSQALRARDILAGMGAKTLGIVVNDVREKGGNYSYGYGGYGYGQGDGDGYHKHDVTYNRISSVKPAEGIADPSAHTNGEANGK